MKHSYFTLIVLILLGIFSSNAQQDPQYTQYMYNTQVVNPAYAGSREALSFGLLYRTQWVGFEGAPKTGTFTVNSPIGSLDNMGLGLSIVRDEIGPSIESNVNIDYSYSINTSDEGKVSFGLKAGLDILDVDFTKLNIADQGDVFENNIDNKLQPQIGAGVYYNTEKFYAGLSVPNFLTTKHFDKSTLEDIQNGGFNGSVTAAERLHYFLIAGYVFDVSENLKFKPATLVKAVSGSPLQWDVSANFLLYEKVTLGAAYRWSAAMSALVGFQATDEIFIGFGYDYQTTDIESYSDGSYEIMLRFDLFKKPERVLTPRFF
ncbi:type IX secretion system PorP/SprF family membrane protein [Ulvibacter sp. MAR_2010_11]|uniref:PorP/SprF family type IX secretion system membrane protein n=1 Tax=Ulvibacter sp. MAR_2010_11 TaxID=1250229 RepID=UPI000C2C4216|nr:type IX secretion system membrane protein PorP/SprF [Ulvibacter sp. MAR_2010_11]PKA83671.1 type IX secretion system PorP/SprF family membrane protein [Ulvibacter sp. MAR_2010_11]PKA83675.1 type IX secretion system PorP/SprF family membrane protein [Ulvibacter sp. MAR_2010_11]